MLISVLSALYNSCKFRHKPRKCQCSFFFFLDYAWKKSRLFLPACLFQHKGQQRAKFLPREFSAQVCRQRDKSPEQCRGEQSFPSLNFRGLLILTLLTCLKSSAQFGLLAERNSLILLWKLYIPSNYKHNYGDGWMSPWRVDDQEW